MELKRLTHEELIPLCTEIFYDYLSNEGGLFWNISEFKELEPDCPTPAHQVHRQYEELLKNNKERVEVYQNALRNHDLDFECTSSLTRQLEYLDQEQNYIKNSNMEYQKKLYEATHLIDYSRTCIRIPLDKIINSYYDDLILEVVYYDDVSTLNGKFNKYLTLTSKEDRHEFIKNNTEITHFGFSIIRDSRHLATIGIMGELNQDDPRIERSSLIILPHKFSDFENLTLKDTAEIQNNDLKQFMQSKIDMDKENLKTLDTQNIRGDEYQIKQDNNENLWIRYICRSTGRVYYNPLNLQNLSLSEYFKSGDVTTYANAWWNLNTLGGKIDDKPVIRL